MTTKKSNHRVRRTVLIAVGSVVGVLALALGVILTVGGIFVPALYLQPWSAQYYEQFDDPGMEELHPSPTPPPVGDRDEFLDAPDFQVNDG